MIDDRVGIRLMRNPFTEKPFIKFYDTKRVGGDIINSKAVKILKLQPLKTSTNTFSCL